MPLALFVFLGKVQEEFPGTQGRDKLSLSARHAEEFTHRSTAFSSLR